MDLSDITRVHETSRQSEVNEFLSLGWRILSVYTTAYDVIPPGCNHQTVHYVLGWPGNDPVFPKRETAYSPELFVNGNE